MNTQTEKKTKRVEFLIEPSLHKKLLKQASKRNISKGEVIRLSLLDFVKE